MVLDEGVDREIGSPQRCDDAVGGVNPPAVDRIGVVPGSDIEARVGPIGTQCRRMGERQGDVTTLAKNPMSLAKCPIQIRGQRERRHGEYEIDLLGLDEGQFCRLGLVELDRDFVTVGQISCRVDLLDRSVDRGDPGASQSKPDRSVAGAAPEFQNPSTRDLAE